MFFCLNGELSVFIHLIKFALKLIVGLVVTKLPITPKKVSFPQPADTSNKILNKNNSAAFFDISKRRSLAARVGWWQKAENERKRDASDVCRKGRRT